MLTRRTALTQLLVYNHYPPLVGAEDFAEAAIEAVLEGEHDRVIEVGGRRGRAGDIFEDWHLEHVVDFDDEAVAS